MDRFVSTIVKPIDAKGRVSIPATFRAVLARDGYEGLYCYPAMNLPAIDAGGNAMIAEMERLLADYDPYDGARDDYEIVIYGRSHTLNIDGEGRIILPEALKSHAGITDAVAFVGRGNKFQIWDPGRFETHAAEAMSRVRDHLAARSRSAGTAGRTSGARE